MEIKDYLPKRIRDRVTRVDVELILIIIKIEVFSIILLRLMMEQDSMQQQ